MTTAIGVLCARVRVEEKQVLTALGNAGAMGIPVPPTGMPLPPRPVPQDLAVPGASDAGDGTVIPGVIIDRATNRQVARPLGRLFRQAGIDIIDAGLAATRNRQEVATAWDAARLPRPLTMIGFSETTGVKAANEVGYPATLLPMIHSAATTVLLDEDTADAVIEHRVVLGTADEAIVLVQAGAPSGSELVRIHVVDGEAIAFDGETLPDGAANLAVRAAAAIGAAVVAIDIAVVSGHMVVWDALPVADFRTSTMIGTTSMGEAIASLAIRRAEGLAPGDSSGVRHVVALSA